MNTVSARMSVFHNKFTDSFIRQNSELYYHQGYRVMITTTFDVIANAQQKNPFNLEPNFFHSTISTADGCDNLNQYALRGFPESRGGLEIKVDGLYCLNGRLLGFNEEGSTTFMYKDTFHLFSRSMQVPSVEFGNKTQVSSLGVIAEVLIESQVDGIVKNIVRHSDYDRMNNRNVSFIIKYIIPPGDQWLHLSRTLTPGQELSITGNIVGRNEESKAWKVQMYFFKVRTPYDL